jgi:hypothetical protein
LRYFAAPFVGSLLAAGCAIGPSVPAGPIQGTGVKLGATWGFGYTPVTVEGFETTSEFETPGEPIETRVGQRTEFASNGGNYLGPVTLGPMRTNFHAAASTYFDVGVDPGLVQSVVQIRLGQLDVRRYLPWAIQVEWRAPGPIDDLNRRASVVATRIELYPHYVDRKRFDQYFIASLGISSGRQYLVMTDVPKRYEAGNGETSPFLEVIMEETRVEGYFGSHFRFGPGMVSVVLAPYIVVDRGGLVAANCGACSFDAVDARHDFGLIFMIAPGAAFEKRPK